MKYFIKTFGCQMNYSDSERISRILENYGFKPSTENKKVNLVVVNSCGVRQTAEDRVFSYIHNIWKNKPQTEIILTGCLAERKDVQGRLKNKVDLFVDIKDFQKEIKNLKLIRNLPASRQGSKFETCLPVGKVRNSFNKKTASDYLFTKPKYTNKYTAYIPIMTGCNNFCAYCVVPYARGREISRPAAEIIQEVKGLIKKGYKEIVLLGQNVNSYVCRGRTATINFSDLLRKINAISGNFWISFISNHPKDFSQELIKTATRLPKVCEFIHLPIQAGDDQILKKMNRHYTRAQYLKLIDKIKKSFQKYKPAKLYSITSDIIVGFPGETKKQFFKSAEVMTKVGFDMVYFGQYSPRPGTTAYQLKNNVPKIEKSRREKYLNEILKKTAFANNQKYLGKTLEILIDKKEISKPSEAKLREAPRSLASGKYIYFGRTRTMKNVKMTINDCHPELACLAGRRDSGSNNLIGEFVKAKIIKANIWNLEGELSLRAKRSNLI